MDRKKLMLLLGALVIAIGTALAARSLLAGGSAPKAEAAQVPQGPKVLVAQRALPVGTIITADAVSFQLWPKEMVQDAYFVDGEADMNKLLGTVVRYPITAGQPVTQGGLVAPGDRGFLAAALGPGMRATTIPVSAKTGVGGFVFPGDHVDLMLTQTVRGEGGGEPLRTTETILRNVRVLATDRSTETSVEDGKTIVRGFRTVTLEVTPKIAEKIQVAQTIGTLSLSLRSLADNQSELDQAIASGSVKVPAGANKAQEEKLLSDAMNRPVEGGTTFVTGGDVSRFQRRNVPSAAPAPRAPSAPYSAPAAASPARPAGPVVRVTRGKTTVEEPVGRN
ncbi:MAG: Flp pilus assembly protein CpaB [Novosphingobium sp.]|uniref:Flp pilus assembly protein CpaB n=1 Tax=Novosphingobium sp. TaxID=1874826 RepID=UPI002634A511|nr:Flp pilus assembly protein CpaB [Novosphingobium sp.]MCP5387639.1 Flp pilus assembly protein CpaB [Novosphingobium sp.]